VDFKHFQKVIRVSETQNITKAAQSLHISQPSLSAYIAKIEEEIGALLFDRNKSPLELTDAGRIYVKTGKEILHLQQMMRHDIDEVSHGKHGKIKVGIPGSRAAYMLPLIYSPFHKEFPGYTVETQESDSQSLLLGLQRKDIDIAILPLLGFQDDFYWESIYKEELLLIGSKDYLQPEDFDKAGDIIAGQLGKYPFILLKKGHGARHVVDNYFIEQGIKPDILIETSRNSTAMRMAASGQGLAIVPRMTLLINDEVDKLVSYSLPSGGLEWDIVAAMVEKNLEDSVLGRFISVARKALELKL
jgi:DNA-binding transcriptional LysR family regulator